MPNKTDERNRDIFATRQTGLSFKELAERFELSPNTVRQIVSMERYRRSVSPNVYYRELRSDDAAV